jgi:hypothetical protein
MLGGSGEIPDLCQGEKGFEVIQIHTVLLSSI